ncbi:30S ribosomal protein S6 [Entomoplasma ellychniae]|uniref:Small ribosomal subunit protein bS6 n=1 Tax=Entomoplasma ellychniae TaxID=2114 RepID=A0A8E2UCY9_9MOLU|nr:30S ribosomal protein S6 [Entomoplasma ellychniae]PPE04862.1 30S ribosomal protein S6 [Entomoplasma ellychniae]
MLRKYEVMFILDQDTQDIKALSTKMIDILQKDGKIIEQNDLGLVEFAYKINHKKKGNYFVVIVEATAEAIKEFERVSNIEKNVIRKLVISIETEKKYEQSVILSKTDMSKYEEERKPRRDFKKPFVKREGSDFSGERRPYQKPESSNAVVQSVKEEVVVSHEEAHDFVSKMQDKYKEHLEKEVIIHHDEETTESKVEAPKLSAEERAKIDGSHNIDEERSELQKYSNKLREIAVENNLAKKLQDVNLRDMTKKELVEYMRKVSASIKKK